MWVRQNDHDSDNIRAKTKQKAIEILRKTPAPCSTELVEIFIDMIERRRYRHFHARESACFLLKY